MKTVLFNQPAGIGDILFLQKAAKYFIDREYQVLWPIIPEFLYIKDYIKEIHFVDIRSDFPYKDNLNSPYAVNTENFIYIPFDGCHHRFGVASMKGKYMLLQYMQFDINDSNWKDYLSFQRNNEREQKCKKILNINENPFIFVNNMFGSPPDVVYRDVNITSSNLNIIHHKPEHINMFNIFDLCSVIENAEEIHTVETSLCYLIEKLNTNAKLYMYSRKINGRLQNPDFSYVDHIYKKNWSYIL